MPSSWIAVLPVLALVPLLAGCAPVRVATAPELAAQQESSTGADLRMPAMDEYLRRMREVSREARPSAVKTGLTTVEGSNPELAAALAAVAVFPSARRHLDVADAYRRAKILDKAHEHLALAVRVDPRNARAYDGMARIWRDWGFPNVGLSDAHRAVYYAPASPEAHNTLGTVLQALGSFASARAEYQHALALDAGAAYALNNLCTLDLVAGDAATAVRHCEQAVSLAPGLRAASLNLEQARALLRAVAVEAPDGRH